MKHDEPVSKIMTHNPTTVHDTQHVSDVRKAMSKEGIHHVPVVSGQRFIGLVTSNDLLRVSIGDVNRQDAETIDAMLDTLTIRDVMSEDLVTVQQTTTIREAAQKLATGHYHCLPILDGENLVGILTSTDLINHLIDD